MIKKRGRLRDVRGRAAETRRAEQLQICASRLGVGSCLFNKRRGQLKSISARARYGPSAHFIIG